jgi:hypothetical protein
MQDSNAPAAQPRLSPLDWVSDLHPSNIRNTSMEHLSTILVPSFMCFGATLDSSILGCSRCEQRLLRTPLYLYASSPCSSRFLVNVFRKSSWCIISMACPEKHPPLALAELYSALTLHHPLPDSRTHLSAYLLLYG